MPVNVLVNTNSEFIFKKQRNWYVIIEEHQRLCT